MDSITAKKIICALALIVLLCIVRFKWRAVDPDGVAAVALRRVESCSSKQDPAEKDRMRRICRKWLGIMEDPPAQIYIVLPVYASEELKHMLSVSFSSYQQVEVPRRSGDNWREQVEVLSQARVVLANLDSIDSPWLLPDNSLVCDEAKQRTLAPQSKPISKCDISNIDLLRAKLTTAVTQSEFLERPCVDEWCIH